MSRTCWNFKLKIAFQLWIKSNATVLRKLSIAMLYNHRLPKSRLLKDPCIYIYIHAYVGTVRRSFHQKHCNYKTSISQQIVGPPYWISLGMAQPGLSMHVASINPTNSQFGHTLVYIFQSIYIYIYTYSYYANMYPYIYMYVNTYYICIILWGALQSEFVVLRNRRVNLV